MLSGGIIKKFCTYLKFWLVISGVRNEGKAKEDFWHAWSLERESRPKLARCGGGRGPKGDACVHVSMDCSFLRLAAFRSRWLQSSNMVCCPRQVCMHARSRMSDSWVFVRRPLAGLRARKGIPGQQRFGDAMLSATRPVACSALAGWTKWVRGE